MRSEQDAERAIETYADMVRRICLVHLKNETDTEDIFQTVFLKYVLSPVSFENEEHEKAWLIRVTLNACRDLLRSVFKRSSVPLEQAAERAAAISEDYRDVFDAVVSLPPKQRDVVYLHYYEGYSAPEISKILGRNVNTVYTWLNRARQKLKETLGSEYELET